MPKPWPYMYRVDSVGLLTLPSRPLACCRFGARNQFTAFVHLIGVLAFLEGAAFHQEAHAGERGHRGRVLPALRLPVAVLGLGLLEPLQPLLDRVLGSLLHVLVVGLLLLRGDRARERRQGRRRAAAAAIASNQLRGMGTLRGWRRRAAMRADGGCGKRRATGGKLTPTWLVVRPVGERELQRRSVTFGEHVQTSSSARSMASCPVCPRQELAASRSSRNRATVLRLVRRDRDPAVS